MPLSRLAGVGNFCFNLLSPFLPMVHIIFSLAILFQILLYALCRRSPWSTLLPLPRYLKLHNLTYLGAHVSTDDMTATSQMALNYHIFDLHNNTHLIPKKFSRYTIDQSHPTYHPDQTTLRPIQPRLIRNSKFPRFTTVQQNWSNTTLLNLSRCFKGKPCFPTNTPLNCLNFHALPIFAFTASDAPP